MVILSIFPFCIVVGILSVSGLPGAFAQWVQVGKDIDGQLRDRLGSAVSMSMDGNRVAIGAYTNSDNGELSGHVQIFENQNNNWNQLGRDIPGEAAGDQSGRERTVALSGDGTTVAIGAVYNQDNAGHVRVFRLLENEWVQLGSDIDGEAAWDFSGHSVSLNHDGSILAVGAPYNDANGYGSGHVRVFRFDDADGTWMVLGNEMVGATTYDYLGFSVSLSADGKSLVAGAPNAETNGASSGQVRCYSFDDSTETWVPIGLPLNGEASNDWFGSSVSMSANGTTVVVAAVYKLGIEGKSGYVKVFRLDRFGNWNQRGTRLVGDASDDGFGRSVSTSADGNMVAVGAPYGTTLNGVHSGFTRVYRFDSNDWSTVQSKIDGEDEGDWSGFVSLSGDGNVVAIGATGNDDNCATRCGHVRVFILDQDGDGVRDTMDRCPDTVIPENCTPPLLPHHYAMLTPGSIMFDSGDASLRDSTTFTLIQTNGCSCEQIASKCNLPIPRNGCPQGYLNRFILQDCFE